jgi:hypothetical protein
MSEQVPGGPPFFQPPANLPPATKSSGIPKGLKLVIGGCLLLALLGGGFIVACGVWVKQVAKNLKDSNLGRTSDTSPPSAVENEPPPASAPADPPHTLTIEKYNLISSHMKREEVEQILGAEGKLLDTPGKQAASKSTYVWQEYVAGKYFIIAVTFINNKVHTKSQSGLREE